MIYQMKEIMKISWNSMKNERKWKKVKMWKENEEENIFNENNKAMKKEISNINRKWRKKENTSGKKKQYSEKAESEKSREEGEAKERKRNNGVISGHSWRKARHQYHRRRKVIWRKAGEILTWKKCKYWYENENSIQCIIIILVLFW